MGVVTDMYHIVALVDGSMTNPNGDPDAGNFPRQDPEDGHGIMTDVSIKRKVRDYVAEVHNQPLYHAHNVVLRDQRAMVLRVHGIEPSGVKEEEPVAEEAAPEPAANEANARRRPRGKAAPKEKREDVEVSQLVANRDIICKSYYDARTFGAVMDTGAARAMNAKGPVIITFARSLDPVTIIESTITRQSVEKAGDKAREMGTKAVIRYGLFRFHVTVHPFLAARTGFSDEDFALLKDALVHMFEFDRSASRHLNLRGLYAFRHAGNGDAPCLGHESSARTFGRVRVSRKAGITIPSDFEDYTVALDVEDLPPGVTVDRWA